MNECINDVIIYGNKDQLVKVRDLFNDVLSCGVYEYYENHNMNWPSFVDNEFYIDEVSDVTYCEKSKEWFVKVSYTSPFLPFLSIIKDILDTIDASDIEYMLYSTKLNNEAFTNTNEVFINTDTESKYFHYKHYVCIDTSKADIADNMFVSFYATDMQDLYSKFQKQYNILLSDKEDYTIHSDETFTKAVEYLKAKGVYINITHATSVYKPEQDLYIANIKSVVNNMLKGER